MGQRHKHADAIIAWAEGAEIEFRSVPDRGWVPILSTPGWYEDCEYRVKLPTKKYRVALFKNGNNGDYYTSTADNQADSNDHEGMPHFVRWLTDWVEYSD